MSWPYDPKDFADAIAAATKANTYGTQDNQEAASTAGQQFQSILSGNDLLQRQFGAGHQFVDPQQQLLAAQLVLQQQQQQLLCPTGILPWGSSTTGTTATEAGRPGSETSGDAATTLSPASASKASVAALGGGPTAAVGAHHHQQLLANIGAAGNPYFGFPFHAALAAHHLGGVGGITPQLGIPSVMHQVHQMQQLQQIQQKLQQMQQLQQQAHAYSLSAAASANLVPGLSASDASQTGDDTRSDTLGPSELLSMINAIPGAASGLGNPLQGTFLPGIGNIPSSAPNTASKLQSANGLQQLIRKTGLSAEEHAVLSAAGVASHARIPKNDPSNTPSNSSSINNQKQRCINNLAALEPSCNDVLSGRGNFVNNHGGNKKFRALVSSQRLMYVAAPKEAKPQFAKKIIEALKSLNPPGRFLQQDLDTKLWYELDEKRAMAKTRQALREGAPDVVKQIKGEDIENEGIHDKGETGDVEGHASSVDSRAEEKNKLNSEDSTREKHYLSSSSIKAVSPEPKKLRPSSPPIEREKQEPKPEASLAENPPTAVSSDPSEEKKEIVNV
jgi:hypothetical protein